MINSYIEILYIFQLILNNKNDIKIIYLIYIEQKISKKINFGDFLYFLLFFSNFYQISLYIIYLLLYNLKLLWKKLLIEKYMILKSLN